MPEEILGVIDPLLISAVPYIVIILLIIENWWWVIVPFVLWKPTSFLWLWWRNEIWDDKQKNILLEIRVPNDILKPIRAMEVVLMGLWQIHQPPAPIEKWWDGQDTPAYSFEVASIDGVPHFLLRCNALFRGMVESHIYSQFPDAEIAEVEDYTKRVPSDMPNKEWDLFAADYKLKKPNPYPIKTYREFETERESKEEKRIDPIASLLEGLSTLKKGEQIWVQIRAKAVSESDVDGDLRWITQGKQIIDKLTFRGGSAPKQSFIGEIISTMLYGPPKKEEKSKDILPPEMKLTSGERDVVAAIEKKLSKPAYRCYIRFVYLGKKGVLFNPNRKLAMSYFTNFVTDDLNAPVPDSPTLTKVRRKWYDPIWFPNRRLYLKKRQSFRKYILRVPYYFPRSGGEFILNVEELATLYHFPSRTLTPSSLLSRVEFKKGEAPYELPVED